MSAMADARQGGNASASGKAAFERDGYVLIPGLLSREEAKQYRIRINRVFGLPEEDLDNERIEHKTFTRADGVTTVPDFWPLVFNRQLLAAVRSLIGDDIRYTQHSDLHINLHGGRYHRDNACREFGQGSDWDERAAPYKVVRIAIYLSEYQDSGSSLIVLPGTHRRESLINRREYVFWNKLRTFARDRGNNDVLPHVYFSGPKRTLKTEPGDCVIFDQRILHAGGVLRSQKPKYAIFLSYGLDNAHAHFHRSFFLKRPTYSPDVPEELRQRLKAENLLLA
jgi:ectoine hydroxylase